MKYLFFLAFMSCLVNSCRTPQTKNSAPKSAVRSNIEGAQVTDTATYIRTQIIGHKEKFTGMTLGVLLDSLLIHAQSFTAGIVPSNVNISGDISLSFVNSIETRSRSIRRQKPVLLTIIWATPLPIDSVNYLVRKFKGEWNAEVEGYFKKQVVKDIGLSNWSYPDSILKKMAIPADTPMKNTHQFIAVQAIEANREKFLRQPLSVLLDSLTIPVKSFVLNPPYANKSIGEDVLLFLVDTIELKKREILKQSTVCLKIIWETPLPLDSIATIQRKFRGAWNAEVEAYYRKQVVKNIILAIRSYTGKIITPRPNDMNTLEASWRKYGPDSQTMQSDGILVYTQLDMRLFSGEIMHSGEYDPTTDTYIWKNTNDHVITGSYAQFSANYDDDLTVKYYKRNY